MKRYTLAMLFAASSALFTSAWAQIYRCGSTYSNEPCPGAKSIRAPDPVAVPNANKQAEAPARRERPLTEREKLRRAADTQNQEIEARNQETLARNKVTEARNKEIEARIDAQNAQIEARNRAIKARQEAQSQGR